MSTLAFRLRKRWEHRWSWPRIPAYIDGELTAAQRRRLERHAALCEECGPLLRSLLRVVAALHGLREPPPATVVPLVLRRLREAAQPPGCEGGPG